uniref:Uncharacterized protein n=1 Tax=Lepeophtheirus salmonis TaxID=72036 RepID=A0A0K2V7Y2_LEPSM
MASVLPSRNQDSIEELGKLVEQINKIVQTNQVNYTEVRHKDSKRISDKNLGLTPFFLSQNLSVYRAHILIVTMQDICVFYLIKKV